MIEWLGIGHLFELSRTEAIAGFFTPLVIFAVFFLAQLILPGKWVPGYVINPETGEPRTYRLNGILVFAIALIVWAFELTGLTCGPTRTRRGRGPTGSRLPYSNVLARK